MSNFNSSDPKETLNQQPYSESQPLQNYNSTVEVLIEVEKIVNDSIQPSTNIANQSNQELNVQSSQLPNTQFLVNESNQQSNVQPEQPDLQPPQQNSSNQPQQLMIPQSVFESSTINAKSQQQISQSSQPLYDVRSSLVAPTIYSYENACEDAKVLRSALKGPGTNNDYLISLSASRIQSQRIMIKRAYQEHEDRDLLNDLKSDLTGDFQQTLVALYMEPGEFDAYLIRQACTGLGTNEKLLIEVLCTRTNEHLFLMQKAWNRYLDNKQSMIDVIKAETQKFLLNGNFFQTLLLKILQCNRPENIELDSNQAQKDAEELSRVLSLKNIETKNKFIEIFTERSWQHIATIADNFERISGQYTLLQAIKEVFAHDNQTASALSVIAEFSQQPFDFWAKKFVESMKGVGTNDSLLTRIVVSRCDIDLANIRDIFGLRYGEGKTLKSWIESDLSGNFRLLILKLCGY